VSIGGVWFGLSAHSPSGATSLKGREIGASLDV
jgi:hypothetical protein